MIKEVDTQTVVSSIIDLVECNKMLLKGIGVRYGNTGLAALYFANFLQTGIDRFRQKGNELLYEAIEKLNDGYGSANIYKEISELGTLISVCKESGIIQDEFDEVMDDFDSIILVDLEKQIKERNYDPATGALMYAPYFLERQDSLPANRALAAIDNLLFTAAKRSNGEAHWESYLKGHHTVYLGLSHGTAGVLNYLKRREKVIEAGSLKDLMREAALYITNKQLINTPLFFPVEVGESYTEGQTYSNNWCYGDPGTLFGLSIAALQADDKNLVDHCNELLAVVSRRKLEYPYLATGQSLLYGIAGLSMLYYKLYEMLGQQYLYDSYSSYIKMLLSAFEPEDEFLGYKGYWNQSHPHINYSFSEGMIGIGLTLLCDQQPELSRFYKPAFIL